MVSDFAVKDLDEASAGTLQIDDLEYGYHPEKKNSFYRIIKYRYRLSVDSKQKLQFKLSDIFVNIPIKPAVAVPVEQLQNIKKCCTFKFKSNSLIFSNMITIRAKITLYKDKGRTWSVKTGYRPLFNFTSESKTSGQITIINKDQIEVGSTGEVLIKFATDKFLGKNFLIGTRFTFDEGTIALGEGEVLGIRSNG